MGQMQGGVVRLNQKATLNAAVLCDKQNAIVHQRLPQSNRQPLY